MFGFFADEAAKIVERRKDRRRHSGLKAHLRFEGGLLVRGMLVDVSLGGCLFRPTQPIFLPTSRACLLANAAEVECDVVRRSGRDLHCRYRSRFHPVATHIYLTPPPRHDMGGNPRHYGLSRTAFNKNGPR